MAKQQSKLIAPLPEDPRDRKRFELAKAAMQGFLSGSWGWNLAKDAEVLVDHSIAIADCMLKKLEETDGKIQG